MDMTSEAKMASRAGSSVRGFLLQLVEQVSGPGTKGTRGAMPKEVVKEDDAKYGKENTTINMKCLEITDVLDSQE